MRSGLKVIQQAVKATVPVESGETRRNIKVRKVKGKQGRNRNSIMMEVRIAAVGALRKVSQAGKTTFYPAIVEYKFRHFMKRAFKTAGGMARKVTMTEIHAGIDREAGRN